TRRINVCRPALDFGQRDRRLRSRDLLALVAFDLAQDVGHALAFPRLETLTRPSRAASALPWSMLACASVTPSARLRARPETVSAPAAFSTAMSRYALRSPSRTARNALALCTASPPLSA